jgi:diguanylate cyclase (GGDEF)-like protein
MTRNGNLDPPLSPPWVRPPLEGAPGRPVSDPGRFHLPRLIGRRRVAAATAAMRRISAGESLDAVLRAAVDATAQLLQSSTRSPVIALAFRMDDSNLVASAVPTPGTGATLGDERSRRVDPLVQAAVSQDRTVTDLEAEPHRIVAPIHSRTAVRAVLSVERRQPPFRDADTTLVDGLAAMATLALNNLVAADLEPGGEPQPADALTGLPDRSGFESRLRALHEPFAVIVVDVDHLDQVNEALGRAAGDAALRSVARVLQASVRERDAVCRTGDDEFSLLTIGSATAVVGSVAERVRSQVAELAGGAFPVRVSVGWAVGAAESPDAVWARAGEALDRAKRDGRNRAAGSITGRPPAVPGRGWTTLLSRTLASQQINPVYQPVVTLPDARIVAYEGLARPANLDGADNVEEFFRTAHRLGVVNELDWICRRAVVRGAEGLRPDAQLYLNIDLSAVSDVDADAEQMVELLRWVGRPPSGVILEVTDADRFSNLGQLAARSDVYRRAGFQIAIDDTGRPGIGIGLLHAVRPDVIKIDSSVVSRCQEDDEARRTIFECIALAAQIGATIVAEGVDRSSIADELARLGVGQGQGFLFGRPEAFAPTSRDLEGEPMLGEEVLAER